MRTKHPFEIFLDEFIPQVAAKSRQLNKTFWILETTGSEDAASLKAELDTELRMFFNNASTYENLLIWDKDSSLQDPILKRQLNVLIRQFKHNMLPTKLIEEIANKESTLALSYANFRPNFEGKALSENDIREILRTETNAERRLKAWEASKEIGEVLAPQILSLVKLRNQAAQILGYPDYFQMQLDLQEVDENWLFHTLDDLAQQSDLSYSQMIETIENQLSKRFRVEKKSLGPWAWSDPFSQEDPISPGDLDTWLAEADFSGVALNFYQKMGIDVTSILDRSDMFERPGKNQHAFCINIDRGSDVRTLNNINVTLKWLETVLHEFGHAIYELGFDTNLPWLLREPPHMITTEAMALIAGRQAYQSDTLYQLIPSSLEKTSLLKAAKESLRRRQLIFSRWVLVMTYFERELYRNPDQDLNTLWWHLVNKYQKIRVSDHRNNKKDWAAKYHIGLAPVYYYSYLLGEMLASAIEETLIETTGTREISTVEAGRLLKQKLFAPGNRMPWSDLVQNVVGHPLNASPWIKQFASI